MGWLSRGASGHRATDRLRPGLATVALGAVLAVTAGACSGPPPVSARDRNWQQDIAYLARELHDDETLVEFPRGPYLALDAQWAGSGLYLPAVPAADRALLGARLLAFDGHPAAQVLARAGTVVDAGNPQLLSNSETGALDDLSLLHSLGLAASTASATPTRCLAWLMSRCPAAGRTRPGRTGCGSCPGSTRYTSGTASACRTTASSGWQRGRWRRSGRTGTTG